MLFLLYLIIVNKHHKQSIKKKKSIPMNTLKLTILIIALLAILLAGLLYFFQEKLMFFPQKLKKSYQFNFGNQNFEELMIKTADDKLINALLFKADSSKGVIFYLHGNAGSLESWGTVAQLYTYMNYDVFILDYRGFGKSEGKITGEKQLFDDNQRAYNKLKERYKEEDIIVLGYSIGTALVAKLAAENNPKLMILQAPFYSFAEMLSKQFCFPTFLLKYKLHTNEYLKLCTCPIIIFHGDKDEIVDYKWSVKLKEEFKDKIELITLHGECHNEITTNEAYQRELYRILMQ